MRTTSSRSVLRCSRSWSRSRSSSWSMSAASARSTGPSGGAILLTLLTEMLRGFGEYRLWIYTLTLMLILFFLPNGLIAPLWRRLSAALADERAFSKSSDVSKRFGGLTAVKDVTLLAAAGRNHRRPRPQWRRQDHAVQPPDRLHCRRTPARSASRDRIYGAGALPDRQSRHRPHVSADAAVSRHDRAGERRRGLPCRRAHARGAQQGGPRAELLDQVGLGAKAGERCRDIALWRSAPARNRPGARHRPKLLLLDEPFAGLGSSEIEPLAQLIRRLHREEKLTILLIEQSCANSWLWCRASSRWISARSLRSRRLRRSCAIRGSSKPISAGPTEADHASA